MQNNRLNRLVIIGTIFLFFGSAIIPCVNSSNLKLKNENETITSASFIPGEEGWKYRKKITIDRDFTDEDLTNFPVLINITDSDLQSDAQNDGDDILFMDGKGKANQLNHEIESYDGNTGKLVAWINIPVVSSSRNTVFYMYYGNPICENQENQEKVWDIYFGGVWHMSEPSGSNRQDSTINNNILYDQNTVERANGIIGYCANLDGISDYFNAPDDRSIDPTVSWTLECWITRDTMGTYDSLIDKYKWATGHGNYAFRVTNSDHLEVLVFNSKSNDRAVSYQIIDTNDWYYCVGSYDDNMNRIRVFVNGQVATSQTSKTSIGTSFELRIGQMGNEGTNFHDGKIDEIRISRIERSHSWINATYNNINTPLSFITVGSCDNLWDRNYWNRPRILPYIIFGKAIFKNYEIPWLNVDWHPALKPYDITI